MQERSAEEPLGSADGEEPIKAKCTEQRAAEEEEPKCVVCGRYGEYICDETNDDVCSLECKAVVLYMRASSASTPSAYAEECHIYREGKPVLPEWELEEVTGVLSPDQVESLRKSIDVYVRGQCAPPPVLDFASCGFQTKLQDNLLEAGYETMTAIQMQAIPAALKGRDMLVSSRTGSGKTLAFILPIIFKCCRIRMGNLSDSRSPLAIVLAPTRELCEQVEEQAKKLGKGLPFKTALVVGGDAMPKQVYRIRNGVELIVATPGRLIDLLLKHGDINLGDVSMLVLDEVDCMLQRGFRQQVMQIIQALPKVQIMLFSATIPPAIHSFSASITSKLLVISAGVPSLPSEAVKQTILWVEPMSKKKKAFEILQNDLQFRPPIIIFVKSRIGADLLSDAVTSLLGIRSASLHGQKPMKERREVLRSFLLGDIDVLVATGVLGRGLDLLRVSQVIIFDMPNTFQEYTHQIGRASRMGVPGTAFAFINNEDSPLFVELVQSVHHNGVSLPHQLLKSPHLRQQVQRQNAKRQRK